MTFLSRIFSRVAPAVPDTGRRMLEAAVASKRFHKTPVFGATAPEVLAGAPAVRGRARHLRHNNPHAANAASIFRIALVGAGAVAASPDTAAATAFAAWSARTGFPAMQAEVVDALCTDGESIVIMRTDTEGRLRLQHVPSEQLDEGMTVDLAGGGWIADGVEHDDTDTPVAYHFRPARATDLFATYVPPVRVPAADVVHVFRRQGAGQTRGLSWFAPVVLALNELDQLADANLTTAKIQAMLTAFLVDQNGAGAASPFADADLSEISLEPGTVRVLPPDWDIRFSTPQQMAASVDLMAVSLRAVAAVCRFPSFCCPATCAA